MNLPQFEFVQPRSVEETCSLLQKYAEESVLLAGGTALIVQLRYRLKKPKVVIGLKGLTGLNYIKKDKELVSIGSLVTLETLESSPVILNNYPPLISAIQQIAVPPIRNQATLGGNLCLENRCIYYNQSEFWRKTQAPCLRSGGEVCYAVKGGKRCQAVYSGDLAPLLMVLNAKVKILSAHREKILPLSDFFTGRGEKPNILDGHELLAEIQVPLNEPGVGYAYEKLRVREGMEFPMAGVAVRIKRGENGSIEQIKMVLGAVGTAPLEVTKPSTLKVGQKFTDEILDEFSTQAMEAARPVGNLIMDSEYRRKMIRVLTKRALSRAWAMAEKRESS